MINQSLDRSKSQVSQSNDDQEEEDAPKDRLFLANKLKSVFKRSEDDTGLLNKLFKFVEVPLNFFRDYTVPMAETAEWDRKRACILPFCVPWAFCFLQGWLTFGDDSVDSDSEASSDESDQTKKYLKMCAFLMIPALLASIYIGFCTKRTKAPENILFFFAIVGFIMSI